MKHTLNGAKTKKELKQKMKDGQYGSVTIEKPRESFGYNGTIAGLIRFARRTGHKKLVVEFEAKGFKGTLIVEDETVKVK